MSDYFRGLADYSRLLLVKIDTLYGIGAGVVLLGVSYLVGLDQRHAVQISGAVLLLSLIPSGFHVYREENLARRRHEQGLRISARIGSFASNIPDPGPDKTSMNVRVFWEVWIADDVWTDRLALNVTYVFDRPWWKFWKRTRFPIVGLPPKGAESTEYRRRLYVNASQPWADSAEFEYITDRDDGGDAHWLIDLVLVAGVPEVTYRVPLALPTHEELAARGNHPPL